MIVKRGFTLIDVLIAVAIVGLLSAIAFPSYQESIRKARRAEVKTMLMQLMQQQERYYMQHTSYIAFSAASTSADAKKFKWYSSETPKTSSYEISATACPGQTIRDCVTLVAEPGTARVNLSFSDPLCGSLSLSSTGKISPAKTGCW